MSVLKKIRESQNLTQEELSDKSGISVRTIQRIEAGALPKGYTLRTLAGALAIAEKALVEDVIQPEPVVPFSAPVDTAPQPPHVSQSKLKLINLSAIPFVVLPPLNILVPVLLMVAVRQKNEVVRQIISLQLLWTILSPVLFMLVVFMKLGRESALITMIVLALANIFIILRNAMEIDRRQKLYFKLGFSLI